MTQKEKELLLKDLSARLPYGVVYHRNDGANIKLNAIDIERGLLNYTDDIDERECKQYLRPMSSMTEEEITKIYEVAKPYIIEEIKHSAESDNPDRKVEIMNGFLSNAVIVDELNKRHLDYRGLIPKNLALEALKDMYNIE